MASSGYTFGNKMEVTKIFTLGYEGVSLETLIGVLTANDVANVIDVRETPASRKQEFCARPLAKHLRSAGIGYVHLCEVGDSKRSREAARLGDISGFRKIYGHHLKSNVGQAGLCKIVQIACAQVTCLLCFEGEPNFCHRSIIAHELENRGLTVRHLTVSVHDRQRTNPAAT